MRRLLTLILSFVIGLQGGGIQQAAPIRGGVQLILPEAITPMTERLYIPLIAKGLHSNYWNIFNLGAQKAANEYGVEITFERPTEEAQTHEQLEILSAALTRNPSAIALAAVDRGAVAPYLESAQSAGIPVIGFDSGVDSSIVKTTVATDNYAAGALAGSKMAELLDGVGKVALIVQDEISKAAADRRDGFIDTMTQRYPGMEVAAIRYGKGDPFLSAELTKEILKEHPDIRGIFGTNEGGAHGIINAMREMGSTSRDVTIIGFDSGRVLKEAIREGLAAGAVTQNPKEMGYKTVETALRAYRGETLPIFIDTGYTWYDNANIDQPEIRELLYE